MVKLRPKILGDIPKGPKTKLKTSAYGHVQNVSQQVNKTETFQNKPSKPITMKDFEDFTQVKPSSQPTEITNTSSITPQPEIPVVKRGTHPPETMGEKQNNS